VKIMDYTVKNFNEKMLMERFSSYVLGVDIGGTNTNLGIAGVKDLKPFLLFSLNFNSQKLESIVPAVQNTLTYAKNKYDIDVDFACIGAAGVVSPSKDSAQLTNVNWNVDANELTTETSLSSVFIINDFQTIGYGINLLDPYNKNDFFQVRARKINKDISTDTKVIIGAGTGLGKSILTYDNYYNSYIPIPSEGGHGDLPIQNDFEMQLVKFIKTLRRISKPLTYEEVLSGRGLESIYLFFRNSKEFKETQYSKEIENTENKASLISKYKEMDETCKETFRLFTRFYARCAKNYVLDTLAKGGLYLAGGIAAKNKEIFTSKDFLIEFENVYRRADILKTVPISVIVNYDVSIYGSCYAAMYKLLGEK
jgi:glucokinase